MANKAEEGLAPSPIIYNEISMDKIMESWGRVYGPGIELSGWFYDCATRTVIVRLRFVERGEPPPPLEIHVSETVGASATVVAGG